jgi:hypothetical protein
MLLDGPTMDAEGPGERLDRGEEPLLEPRDQQGRRGLLALGLGLETFLAPLPVFIVTCLGD